LAQPGIGEAALNRLPVGVIVVDHRVKVVFMNPLGAEYVAAKDGLSVEKGDTLRAADPDDTVSLHEMVRHLLERPSMAHPYAVRAEIMGEPESDDGKQRMVLLFLTDPEKPPEISTEILDWIFGLTESESRLAAENASGATLGEAAEKI